MMTKDKPGQDQNVHSANIRALSSITSEQAEIIVQTVHVTGPGWDVQTADDYNGYLSILTAPDISADKPTSFFVAGTAQRLELFEVFDDNMTQLSSFNGVEDLSAVASCSASTRALSSAKFCTGMHKPCLVVNLRCPGQN